jgi:hypothetical protein
MWRLQENSRTRRALPLIGVRRDRASAPNVAPVADRHSYGFGCRSCVGPGRAGKRVGITLRFPFADVTVAGSLGAMPAWFVEAPRTTGSSGFDLLGFGFRATYFDNNLHSIFHRIFEGHLDSEQAVLVDRFGFVRFHCPSQSQC